MPEANYKRPNEAFESSDDLIEDYDNFEFKPKCVEKLSGLEKLLLVVLGIFLIIILALGIALGKANNAPKGPGQFSVFQTNVNLYYDAFKIDYYWSYINAI